MTSSPAPTPSAIIATRSASVPEETPMASGDAKRIGQLTLERGDLGPLDEPLAVADRMTAASTWSRIGRY